MMMGALIWDTGVREALRVGGIAGLIVWGAVGLGTVILAAVKEVELEQEELAASSRYAKALASMCPGDPADRGWVGSKRGETR